MDYYFCAADAAAALAIRQRPGGPADAAELHTVEAKDILASPHLELLVQAATGREAQISVDRLVVIWPPKGTPPPTDENSPFMSYPSIMQIPDDLRDALAAITVTPEIAETWCQELWGYDPDDAARIAEALTALARTARAAGKPVYWWSEL